MNGKMNWIQSHNFSPHALIEVTRRCDMYCQHCYNCSGKALQNELDAKSLGRLIRECFDLGMNQFSLSGGEPSLRNDLEDILEEVGDLSVGLNLFSNGVNIDRSRMRRLAEFLSGFAVSIDGDEKYHDRFRAKRGAFRQVMGLIELLHEFRIPFSVQSMVTAKNYERLSQTVDFIVKTGASAILLSHLGPQGRALLHPQLILSPRQMSSLHRRSRQWTKHYGISIITNMMHKKLLQDQPEKFPKSVFYITPQGQIFPWYALKGPWQVGEVSSESMSTLLPQWEVNGGYQRTQALFERARQAALEYPYSYLPLDDIIYQLSLE